jgi:hypothetical protein
MKEGKMFNIQCSTFKVQGREVISNKKGKEVTLYTLKATVGHEPLLSG